MKKRLLVLVLPALIAGSLILPFGASALGICGFVVCKNADVRNATYEFLAADKMQFTADFGGDIVTFTDTQPQLKNHVYRPAPADLGLFCGNTKIKIFKDEYLANVDPMPALTKIEIIKNGKCRNMGAQHILVDLP